MKRQIAISKTIFCLVVLLIALPRVASPQTINNAILSQRIELHLRKVTLMHALGVLSVEHRVPTGIEYAAEDTNEPKLYLETGSSSLKEILDSIVKQEPLYRWELVDGVINFAPVRNGDPFFEALLNTAVSNYDPGKWTIKFELRDAIENAPEVKKLLESKNIELAKYRDYGYHDSIYTPKEPSDLRMSNTTVRAILNRIVKISEHKRWAVGWRKGEKNVFSIWL